jgi:hypothetical protein
LLFRVERRTILSNMREISNPQDEVVEDSQFLQGPVS